MMQETASLANPGIVGDQEQLPVKCRLPDQPESRPKGYSSTLTSDGWLSFPNSDRSTISILQSAHGSRLILSICIMNFGQ
jgi:hypothetical protein